MSCIRRQTEVTGLKDRVYMQNKTTYGIQEFNLAHLIDCPCFRFCESFLYFQLFFYCALIKWLTFPFTFTMPENVRVLCAGEGPQVILSRSDQDC